MSSPQIKVTTDSAETMTTNASTEAAAISKPVIEADLNVSAANGDMNISVDRVEAQNDGAADDDDGTEHEYRVGDLVWAKIKSHPWWPGQIHDPKDASEYAARPGQEGRLLVAFFGDGSFSWCSPSQLMPFVENFSKASRGGSSRSFLNAVNKAVEEVGRVLGSYMTCGCVSSEKRDALSRPIVENAGVKAGILVPEVDVARLSLPNYEASDVFSRLISFAKNVPTDSVLDLGVVRGWISAFHRSKGLDRLQEYEEPVYIEGLEDNSSDNGVSEDLSVPIRAPGPQEEDEDNEDGPSSPNSSASIDKHRRRRKSVNDIMAESLSVSPKRRKRTPVVYTAPIVSIKSAVRDEDVAGSSGKKNEKEKVKGSESPKTADGVGPNVASSGESKRKPKAKEAMDAKDDTTEHGSGTSDKKKNDKGKAKDSASSPKTADEVGPNMKRKPETIEVVNTKDAAAGSDEVREEGDDIILTPRERKKSKYLTNPYVEPIGRVGSSSFKKMLDASKEVKTSGEGEHAVITTKPAEDRSVDGGKEGNGDKDSDMDITLSSLKSKVDLPVKKAKPAKAHSPEKAKSQERENPEAAKKAKGKTASSEKSKSKKSAESSQAEEKALFSLVLAFTSGFPLPSKDEILTVYSAFGSLNQQETQVFADSHSAHVVFKKLDDAEAAFKSSVSENPFGVDSVEAYWLRYGSRAGGPHLPEGRRAEQQPEGSDKAVVVDDALSEMNVIRKKLEITDAILGAYHGKFKEADKESLKVDFRNLKERVEAVCKTVNELAESTKLSKERGE